MKRSQLIFFCAVLLLVIVIARCNSRTTGPVQSSAPSPSPASELVPAASSSPTPTPALIANTSATPSATAATQANQTPSPELRKIADKVGPAMALISIFDASGKLVRNCTGFFISPDGRLIVGRSDIEGGAHAVAKTTDGRIHNVAGILADAAGLDLAILKAQPKQPVPFFSLKRSSTTETGTRVAVIGNPMTRKDLIVVSGTITVKQSDQNGESFELSTPIPTEALGGPVVNETGEVVGVVTHGASNTAANIIRAGSALDSLLSEITPATKTRWQLAGEPSPPAAGPSPVKNKPSPSPSVRAQSRLVYNPAPPYPSAARRNAPSQGSGRYRITFSSNGDVKSVTIVQSTHNDALDQAAVETLRKWRSQPGQEWTANVPITFQP